MGAYHHIPVLATVTQHLLQPDQLPPAMGSVAAVEEHKQVLCPAHSLHRHRIGRGVKIFLIVLLAVEINIVVADDDKTGVLSRPGHVVIRPGQTQQAVHHTERGLPPHVGNVTAHNAEHCPGVGILGIQEIHYPWGRIGDVDVGSDIYSVLVRYARQHCSGVLFIPCQPLLHTVFGVGATGEKHTLHVQPVATCRGHCR